VTRGPAGLCDEHQLARGEPAAQHADILALHRSLVRLHVGAEGALVSLSSSASERSNPAMFVNSVSRNPSGSFWRGESTDSTFHEMMSPRFFAASCSTR